MPVDLPSIDPDISVAETPPGSFYRDPALYAASIERVFARTWQIVGDAHDVRVPQQCTPVTLLEGSVDEPLVLTRDADDRVHCLSNVCTHRGTLVCEHGGVLPVLRCRYHGRRFGLDGRFVSMPEFEGVQGFPTERDALRALPVETWGPFIFTAIAPACRFADVVAEMHRRVGFLPLASATLDPSRSRDYMVKAHWALYCENYLEGLHIPYIHAGLSAALDYGAYRTELFRYANLQLGVASRDEDVFDIPPGWPDHGTRVAAFYFWLFPNTMINVYPGHLAERREAAGRGSHPRLVPLVCLGSVAARSRGRGVARSRRTRRRGRGRERAAWPGRAPLLTRALLGDTRDGHAPLPSTPARTPGVGGHRRPGRAGRSPYAPGARDRRRPQA